MCLVPPYNGCKPNVELLRRWDCTSNPTLHSKYTDAIKRPLKVLDNYHSEAFDITSLKIPISSLTSLILLVMHLVSSIFAQYLRCTIAIYTIQYHNVASLIDPFFHQNLPETGIDRNEDETMTADGCNFFSILRTHVVTGHNIIEVFQSVVVFPQTKFCRVTNFLKSCY